MLGRASCTSLPRTTGMCAQAAAWRRISTARARPGIERGRGKGQCEGVPGVIVCRGRRANARKLQPSLYITSMARAWPGTAPMRVSFYSAPRTTGARMFSSAWALCTRMAMAWQCTSAGRGSFTRETRTVGKWTLRTLRTTLPVRRRPAKAWPKTSSRRASCTGVRQTTETWPQNSRSCR